ncbi:MAG: hypothetical protein SVU32_08450, partial [Candidatus Nanohaloarchaea archaeon]|nr:hypothetical protein [Candidatus Nanohaloarchaea archaeon]
AISQQLEKIESQLSVGGGQGAGGAITEQIALVRNIDSAVPPTLMLLIISLYLIEVSLILAYFTNGIENGFDEINRDIAIGRTLIYAVILFTVIVMLASGYITPFVSQIGG